MDSGGQNIPILQRAAAVCLYLGVSPLAYCFPNITSDFTKHHIRQSLALFAFLFLMIPLMLFGILLLSYAMIHHRSFFEAQHLEPLLLTWIRRMFLIWLVFWAFGILLAVFGSVKEMPLLGRLARTRFALPFSAAILFCIYALLATSGVLIQIAKHKANGKVENAQLVILYDDVNRYPAWIFHLGFYAMISAGYERWGDGGVALEKITKDRLEQTIRTARFVFLATHGQAKGVLMEGKYVKAADLKPGVPPAKRRLQFVYLAGCDSGTQRVEWEKVFAPAEVITYDRLSAMIEHLWWMWNDGPAKIRTLEEAGPQRQDKPKVKIRKQKKPPPIAPPKNT